MEEKFSVNADKGKETVMDYHCNWCGFDFFFEEGYNAEVDDIMCPRCNAIRAHCNYFIVEV